MWRRYHLYPTCTLACRPRISSQQPASWERSPRRPIIPWLKALALDEGQHLLRDRMEPDPESLVLRLSLRGEHLPVVLMLTPRGVGQPHNQDPDYLRDLLLYRLTFKAQRAIAATPLSRCEIIRRLRTSTACSIRRTTGCRSTSSSGSCRYSIATWSSSSGRRPPDAGAPSLPPGETGTLGSREYRGLSP
jgi:hypothetical protein